MPDREKVIGHLNDCMEASRRDNTWVFVRKDIVEDALALLKEQEPIPIQKREIAHMWFLCCGSCGVAITAGDRFCRMCGKAVKWE